jgi:hypothetical protein
MIFRKAENCGGAEIEMKKMQKIRKMFQRRNKNFFVQLDKRVQTSCR